MKRLLAIFLCLLLIFSGCTPNNGAYVPTGDGLSYDEGYTGPQNTHKPDETPKALSLAYYRERSLNPYLCTDFTNRVLFSLLYQSLFTIDRDYKVEPQLCKSFTTSRDSKIYTFYLENAHFSDGTALTADDVVASLNAARASAFYQGRFTHIVNIEKSADGGVTITLDGNTATAERTVEVSACVVVNQELVDELAQQVLSKILKEGMTPHEKLETVFNYVRKNMHYQSSSDTELLEGAYRALTRHSGDCFNYFAITKVLLDHWYR
mgnify:CR=1 FL=1